jgi:hypothetical protein
LELQRKKVQGMKLTRRSFIASIAAAGLLSAMPKPVRAWADNLHLPKGVKLTGFKGQLIATVKTDQWKYTAISVDNFDWHGPVPLPYTQIPYEFDWAVVRARQQLGMKLSEMDFQTINHAATSQGKYPLCV